jgi:hypothetical protein
VHPPHRPILPASNSFRSHWPGHLTLLRCITITLHDALSSAEDPPVLAVVELPVAVSKPGSAADASSFRTVKVHRVACVPALISPNVFAGAHRDADVTHWLVHCDVRMQAVRS